MKQLPKLNEYHHLLGFPVNMRSLPAKIYLRYSNHAMIEARKDRLGAVILPRWVYKTNWTLIEASIDRQGYIRKATIAVPYDDQRELCIVLLPNKTGYSAFVKTVWLVKRKDCYSLPTNKSYVKP